ncbi:peptidase M23 [Aliishimia ponticola]|uniref:Peptidase M23 n=1 Tax=Aliishimia ponticola TaxID=2499833 RepID=A0A4S4N7V8_9RHOB|nr:peptidoglycan DD-metalloendopeptidase family protein [Aliishimia ponticola]THH35264.1 peptidase M23 [Aliishimia ponticola]
MIRRASLLFAAFLMATPLSAQSDMVAVAEAALARLEAATDQLGTAEKARDRVAALTDTILAFEDGLAAIREGLRRVAVRERVLSERLRTQDAEIAALMGVLQSLGRENSPTVLLHPAGALGTARASMLLAEMGPAMNARAATLRSDLTEARSLRALQQAASGRIEEGLQQLQEARAALNTAIAERQPLPQRFTADPTRTAILIASTETLEGFASGLSQITEDDPGAALTMPDPDGNLPLPVNGVLLHGAGEADAAGVVREGILLATRPQALVTAPTAATIRFIGDLLDLGQVVVLEPRADSLIILAGLGRTYGKAGLVIPEGEPIGMMGVPATDRDELLSPSSEGAGTDRTETLYIEVRQDNRPVDPTTWFRLGPTN